MRFLRRLWERRQLGRRELFPYHDGTRQRWGDPFRIYRALVNNQEIDFAQSQPAIDSGLEPETSRALGVLRQAFDVRRWDETSETGLTDWELFALLQQFNAWMEALKKNGSPSATPSESTGSTSSTSPACQPEATNYSLPFSCVSSESNPDAPLDKSWPPDPALGLR